MGCPCLFGLGCSENEKCCILRCGWFLTSKTCHGRRSKQFSDPSYSSVLWESFPTAQAWEHCLVRMMGCLSDGLSIASIKLHSSFKASLSEWVTTSLKWINFFSVHRSGMADWCRRQNPVLIVSVQKIIFLLKNKKIFSNGLMNDLLPRTATLKLNLSSLPKLWWISGGNSL